MTILQKQLILAYMGFLAPEDADGIWGPLSAAATEKAQHRLNIHPDGVWGDQTDAAVREYIYSGADLPDVPEQTGTFWDHIRYFTREEFRCRCGANHLPYCDGFPAEPDQTLVELADDLRHHFGRPAHPSSGLRCRQHNADQPNAAANSKHLYGKALDFFIEGVSGDQLLAAAKADPRTNYAYKISGQYVHIDVK